jgi:hypothetical protein
MASTPAPLPSLGLLDGLGQAPAGGTDSPAPLPSLGLLGGLGGAGGLVEEPIQRYVEDLPRAWFADPGFAAVYAFQPVGLSVANRASVFTSSGAMVGGGAVVAGVAERDGAAVSHATSGAMVGGGASVSGTAQHMTTHATSGVLAGAGAVVSGSASRSAPPGVHETSGAMSGGGAVLSGFSDHLAFGVQAADLFRRLSRRRTLRAVSERLVNYMLKRTEPSQEKAGFYREQVPGLVLLAQLDAEIRGAWWTGSRFFVVAGADVLEVADDWTTTTIGTIGTTTGRVEFAQGLFQLVVVDGVAGYVITLASSAFAQITDPDFYPADRVMFLDGKFIFHRVDTQQWFWSSSIDAAEQYDGLDFASAESSPDKITSLIVDHREIWLFGEWSTEVWFSAPSGNQVYARNNGATIEVGCAATFTPQRIDNTVYWLGKDKHGQGIVWSAGGQGYQPVRISDQSVEDALAKVEDLSGAWAWVYQEAGQTFYVLQVPGVETTWVYDASVRQWHERAELTDRGNLERWRASTHCFAFGTHVVGDEDGSLYQLDPYEWTNAGDPMPRIWVTPHNAIPTRNVVFYESLRLDVTVGETASGVSPNISMRYSDDGGATWGGWLHRSTGQIGQFDTVVEWHRLGSARDRVWEFRTTDDAKVSLIGMSVKAQGGNS